MKSRTALAFIPAICLTGVALAQTAGNAVDVDPEIHRVILDNEYFRAFDARASAGAKSPMHTHAPMVLVCIGMARFRITTPDGKTSILDFDPGDVFWVTGAQHSWQLLAGELHAIGIEIKSAQMDGAPPAPTAEQMQGDAVSVDPDTHHVILENPHVRVFEGRASHGMKSPMHAHPPTILVSLAGGRIKFTTPDGKSSIHDFSPGKVLWFADGATHSWEFHSGDARVIAIEVKAARKAAP